MLKILICVVRNQVYDFLEYKLKWKEERHVYSVWVNAIVCDCFRIPVEGVGTGVIGGYQPPGVGGGNWTQIMNY